MEEKSRFAEMMDSVSQWLGEQEWFQQLKAKWEELDPQSRLYLQLAAAGGSAAVVLVVLLSFYLDVRQMHKEINDKSEVLAMVTSATDELRSLQTTNQAVAGGAGAQGQDPWPAYFEATAATAAGIQKPSLTVSDPKDGPKNDVSKETLFDVTLKKVSIRQAVRFAVGLESGARPVKLRNLTIDTQPDMSGYLDVTLSLSAFALVQK